MYAYWKIYEEQFFVYTTKDMKEAQQDPARIGPVFTGSSIADAIAAATKWEGLEGIKVSTF